MIKMHDHDKQLLKSIVNKCSESEKDFLYGLVDRYESMGEKLDYNLTIEDCEQMKEIIDNRNSK